MELKRLLTRATALLLKGAYQGAESFIEQAMAESDKLKQELSEIDTLRTRVTEMAAEIERLQSVIDDANAQESLTTIQVLQGYPHVVSHSQCGVKDGIYKVYAERPIPAQQSPAVAAPKPQKCCAFWRNDAIENAALIAERYAQVYCAQDIRNMKRNETSPRITEEDELPKYYREEWRHHVMLMWSCVRKHDSSIPSDVLDYMREQLLNKLNGDHNGK